MIKLILILALQIAVYMWTYYEMCHALVEDEE